MTPSGVEAVGQRIASIHARFRPTPGFQAALHQAQRAEGQEGQATTGVSSSEAVDHASAGSAAGTGRSAGQVAPTGGTGGERPAWAERLPESGRPWAPAIERAATAAGIEPELLAAVVQAESGFQPDARSHAGAIGLAQLMPQTAAHLGVDPTDPEDNLAGGARYLREQLDRFGAVDLALAAYNAGPHRVAQAGGVPQIAETQSFIGTVRDNYTSLR